MKEAKKWIIPLVLVVKRRHRANGLLAQLPLRFPKPERKHRDRRFQCLFMRSANQGRRTDKRWQVVLEQEIFKGFLNPRTQTFNI